MTIDELQSEVERLTKELEAAKKAQIELSDGNPRAIAELLHEKLCRQNHTDGCDWQYRSWENLGYARTEWLQKATQLIDKAKELGLAPATLAQTLIDLS